MDNISYNSKFIKSFSFTDITNEDSVDGLVYHYTSPEAFLSIITSGKVRFTDVRYLNDKSETIFFAKKLIEFVEKNGNMYPSFVEIVKYLLPEHHWDDIKNLRVEKIPYNEDTIFSFKSDRAFVFCASKNSDALNMWNYYVKNGLYQGYNLGILKKDIIDLICK